MEKKSGSGVGAGLIPKVTNKYALQQNDIWTSTNEMRENLIQLIAPIKTLEDGKYLYPTDFFGEKDPRDIFKIKKIEKNVLVNPPFSCIELHFEHWEKVAKTSDKVIAVICPQRKREPWFNKLTEKYFHITYSNKLKYLQGEKELKRGISPFITTIIFLNLTPPESKKVVLKTDATGKIKRFEKTQQYLIQIFQNSNKDRKTKKKYTHTLSPTIKESTFTTPPKDFLNNNSKTYPKQDIFEKYPTDLISTLSETGKHALLTIENTSRDCNKLF